MPAVRLLLVAALGALWASGALAQKTSDNGWYLGGGIRPPMPTLEDTDIGYRHFGGYRFSRNWGVELGYSDLGRSLEGEEPWSHAQQRFGAQTSAWTVAGTGVLPLGNAFSIQGRLGFSLTAPDATLIAPGSGIGSALPRYRSTVLWGFGGQYDVTGSVGLRLDYNNFGRLNDDPNGARSDLWSINAVVRF